MWLHAGSFLPVRMRYDLADGDFTIIDFKKVQQNIVIDDQQFSLDLPKDVKIDKTLSRASGEK